MAAPTEGRLIEIDARWDNLPALNDYTAMIEEECALTDEQSFVLGLVVEEIVTNIIKYSYREAGGPLQLICSVASGLLTIRIRDRGEPFDPSVVEAPSLDGNVNDRPVGGLGVFLVQELADSLEYTHDEASGWNELIVTKQASQDSNIAPLVEFLQRLPMFNDVPEATIAGIVQSAHHLRLAPREMLFREGDVGAECFIVMAGDVDVIKQVGSETMLLERCRPGAIIGEMALIDNSPRAASVRARTSATLLRITEAEFVTMMHANPNTAMALLRGGTTRLRSSNARMISGLEAKNAQLAQAYEDLKAAQGELLRLERIERELAIARDIQRFFLPPKIVQPSGWQIVAFNQGALEVGGDFYDVLKLGDGRVGLVVADACGKGVPAALFVALTRSLLRSASQALAANPALVTAAGDLMTTALTMTNNYISREHGASNMFTTLFYAVLDPETATLTYVNAGHNPPIIVDTATGNVRYLEGSSLPLGIMDNLPYPALSTTLAPTEMFLGFTDGATEAFNPAGDVFDDEHLIAVVRARRYHDAASLLEQVKTAIMDFVGTAPQADDITLLTVSRI
ncbi:MAG: SpoIIE family protein phosphatase [Herpetosiphonaceae bacterium]|nr:SpoIIE family protein phosphatase [Herpetosiphonaceae bacterium]